MRLIHARTAIAATGAAIALLATACGGGADSARSPTGEKTGEASTSGSVVTGSAVGSPAPTDRPSSGGSGGFCDVVRSEMAKLKPLVPPRGVAPTPAQLRVFYPASVTADKRTAEAAPPDIKADADRSAQKAAAFATVLERANYDISKVPPDAGTDDDDGSVSRVDAYVKRVCGFDRTTG
jgi:hypothetical protein